MFGWNRAIAAGVLVASTAVLLVPARETSAKLASIRVRNEAQFDAAVAALRNSGGTIVLAPRAYRGQLIVPGRSKRLLRIVGEPGALVERILLDHTQRVAVAR